jgi:hypothetical protein
MYNPLVVGDEAVSPTSPVSSSGCPTTVSVAVGDVVPMPTLPPPSTRK